MADRSAFYSTIATVLPLFVLALTAERRLGPRPATSEPGIQLLIGLAVVSFAAMGELVAIGALLNRPAKNAATFASLATGLAGVFLYADLVLAQVGKYRELVEAGRYRTVASIAGWVLIGLAVLLLGTAWLGAIL